MARPSIAPTRDLVLRLLRRNRRPMSAYALLEKLAPHGIKGPPVVYRALEALSAQGKVHKIQAIGAYIACNCDNSHDHALSVLTVCGDCHSVSELHDHAVMHHLEKLKSHGIALREHAIIELPVTCENCAR